MVFGTRSATTSPGSDKQQRRWEKSCAVDIIMLDKQKKIKLIIIIIMVYYHRSDMGQD